MTIAVTRHPATPRHAWRTQVRLALRGRWSVVRFARVVVDVTPAEVCIAPRSRHAYRWGERRLRRYFDAAHELADALT
jgi:hypothetical protein